MSPCEQGEQQAAFSTWPCPAEVGMAGWQPLACVLTCSWGQLDELNIKMGLLCLLTGCSGPNGGP